MENNLLYHGSAMEVIYPEIRITRYTKDFSWGFYCTIVMNRLTAGLIEDPPMEL